MVMKIKSNVQQYIVLQNCTVAPLEGMLSDLRGANTHSCQRGETLLWGGNILSLHPLCEATKRKWRGKRGRGGGGKGRRRRGGGRWRRRADDARVNQGVLLRMSPWSTNGCTVVLQWVSALGTKVYIQVQPSHMELGMAEIHPRFKSWIMSVGNG